MPEMREIGRAVAGALVESVREWTAIIGGLGSGLGAGLLLWQGQAGSVPGVVCLVLAAGGLVAAFFGMRDRDLGGWAAAVIALVLGFAAFVAFALAAQG
ncbi:hypothetical protein [Actinophytocola sp.]|jgi:hypothetical protein|uniref:hypothetical protein n=1 Tax=Actinophytocola sp. TaxID=1872138 RepID=UPI002EDB1724